MAEAHWLEEYLAEEASPPLSVALRAIADAGAAVAALVAEAQATPERAREAFSAALSGRAVAALSMPGAGCRELGEGGLAVAVAPLMPADLREVGTGSLFSIYPSGAGAEAAFLRPGTEQLAAGCLVYGAGLSLALTLGAGSALFRREAGGRFRLVEAALEIPESTGEFAANAAEYRHWDAGIRRFVDDFFAGAEGPRARDFDMRWTGSLPADCLRILTRGGVYLSPYGTAERLDLVHHARPVAFLAEQAGGRATDGLERLLNIVPERLETPVPLVFGAAEKVARLAALHDLPDSEVSPLFARRGLFRL